MSKVQSLADLARHAGFISQLHAQGEFQKLDQMLKTIPAEVLADAVFDNMARVPSPEAVGAVSGAQASALFAKMLKVCPHQRCLIQSSDAWKNQE